jgi:hypothetical protein
MLPGTLNQTEENFLYIQHLSAISVSVFSSKIAPPASERTDDAPNPKRS